MKDARGFQLAGNAAETYEKVLVPLWFGRWAEDLLDLVGLQPGQRVLDVACGTGVTTRLARASVGDTGRVTGLDINAPMLAKARDLARGLDIAWVEGDVGETGLADNSFDVAISQHGYHYFPDKPRALAELGRVLVPGGRLAFSIWAGHSPYTAALCDAVARHISPEIAARQRGQRETPDADRLLYEVQGAGFSDARVVTRTLTIRTPAARKFVPLHLNAMPIAGAFQALSRSGRDRLTADVEAALAGYARDGELVYPDAVHVVSGRKHSGFPAGQ